MRRATIAGLAVSALLATTIVAHATTLTVDAGTLQVLHSPFTFEPPASTEEDCKNNGWQNFVDDQGQPFNNQGRCVSYVNGGGVLYPKGAAAAEATLAVPTADDADGLWSRDLEELAAQPCYEDGWRSEFDGAGQPYDSEAACAEARTAEYRERTSSTEGG